MNTTKTLLSILIVIGLVLVVGVFKNNGSTSLVQNSILERVKSEKTIRVGYAAYPPYVIKDLKTGELSGYYIDIMNETASRAGLKVEWVETTWQTFISDLQTGKFDVIDDPMFATIPRWAEINFTYPLGYFSGVAGLAKNGDFRFSKIDDLNKKGVTIYQIAKISGYHYKKTPSHFRHFFDKGNVSKEKIEEIKEGIRKLAPEIEFDHFVDWTFGRGL